jgi:hypothetical protein
VNGKDNKRDAADSLAKKVDLAMANKATIDSGEVSTSLLTKGYATVLS